MKNKLILKTISTFLIINLIFFSSNYWLWAGKISLASESSQQENQEISLDDNEAGTDEQDKTSDTNANSSDDVKAEDETENKSEINADSDDKTSSDQDDQEVNDDQKRNSADQEQANQTDSADSDIEAASLPDEQTDISQFVTEQNQDSLSEQPEPPPAAELELSPTPSPTPTPICKLTDEEQKINYQEQDSYLEELENSEEQNTSQDQEQDPNNSNTSENDNSINNQESIISQDENSQKNLDDDNLSSATAASTSDKPETLQCTLPNIENTNPNTKLDNPDSTDPDNPSCKEIYNDTFIDTSIEGISDTGNNTSQGEAEGTIETGDAAASANIVNQANLLLNQTILEILFFEAGEDFQQDIDLNQFWTYLIGLNLTQFQLEEPDAQNLNNQQLNNADLTNLTNIALVETEINLSANSGYNHLESNESSIIKTGDASALANLINLINLDINDSIFLLGAININSDYTGSIILPRPEKLALWFDEMYELRDMDNLDSNFASHPYQSINNTASINERVTAAANTGGNQQEINQGSGEINTGNADAQINNLNLINSNYYFGGWYYLMLNNWDNWTGQTNLANGSLPWLVSSESNLQKNQDGSSQTQAQQTNNQAVIDTQINLQANTGYNHTYSHQSGSIQTGNAMTTANLTNIVNSNFNQTRWFMSWINIMSSWNGNLIFAYPELDVSLTAQPVSLDQQNNKARYQLITTYSNLGYDPASNTQLSLTLPGGAKLINTQPKPSFTGNPSIGWSIGSLDQGETNMHTVAVDLELPSEGVSRHTFNAAIQTSDPELNYANNQASVTIVLEAMPINNAAHLEIIDETNIQNQEKTVSNEMPELIMTAKNNVGTHILSGDTIIFELNLYNQGPGGSYNTIIHHDLYDEQNNFLGRFIFEPGDIPAGKQLDLSFEFQLNNNADLPNGFYSTVSQGFGIAENGVQVGSNPAETFFRLLGQESLTGFVQPILASEDMMSEEMELQNLEPDEKKVLGAQTNRFNFNIFHWLLLLLSLSLIGRGTSLLLKNRSELTESYS